MATAKNRAHRRLVLASSAVARTVDSTLDAIGAGESRVLRLSSLAVSLHDVGGYVEPVSNTNAKLHQYAEVVQTWMWVPACRKTQSVRAVI